MMASEGMILAMENGIHRYFEVSAIQSHRVTSIITDVIKSTQESKKSEKSAKLLDHKSGIYLGFT